MARYVDDPTPVGFSHVPNPRLNPTGHGPKSGVALVDRSKNKQVQKRHDESANPVFCQKVPFFRQKVPITRSAPDKVTSKIFRGESGFTISRVRPRVHRAGI